MKNKLCQPMDTQDAISYIYNNQYDNPRKMICTAKKLPADICAVFDQEMTVMLLEAIHSEDYVLVLSWTSNIHAEPGSRHSDGTFIRIVRQGPIGHAG